MSAAAQQIPAVQWTPEFDRIYRLPRRDLALVSTQTPELRTEAGRAAGVTLRDLQARSCVELNWYHGLFCALPVGLGKTLLMWLAALIKRSRRPHVFMPANLKKDKTPRDFAALSKHWVSNQPAPTMHSYAALTQEKNLDLLDRLQPDLLILEEAHNVSNFDGSAAQRLDRYIMAHPECVVVVLTGTIMRKSLKDFAHLLRWTHRDRSPLPRDKNELWTWCQALDDDAGLGRWDPGALLHFEPYEEFNRFGQLARARNGVQRRIRETPGVIIVDEELCDQPLTIRLCLPPPDAEIEERFRRFRESWEAPDGWPFTTSLEVFTHVRQLGAGFYQKHVPRPPADELELPPHSDPFFKGWTKLEREPPKPSYVDARRMVSRFIRDDIRGSRIEGAPRDTDGAVRNFHRGHPVLEMWARVEPIHKPETEAEWFSRSVVDHVYRWAQWIASRGVGPTWDNKGLIWIKYQEIAEALARVLCLPYFGSEGRQIANGKKTKISIEDPSSQTGTVILSYDANREGRNLQPWCHNLIVGWEQSPLYTEQFLGRTHRFGQSKPVTYDVILTSGETHDSFFKTIAKSRVIYEVQGHTQKILRAEIQNVRLPEGARWASAEIPEPGTS